MFHTVTPTKQAPQKDEGIPIPSHQPFCFRYERKQVFSYIRQMNTVPHTRRERRNQFMMAAVNIDVPESLKETASKLVAWEEKFGGEFYIYGGTVRKTLLHLWFSWPFEKIDDLDIIATTNVSLDKLQESLKSPDHTCKEITGIFENSSQKKLLQLAKKITGEKVQPYGTVYYSDIKSFPLTYERAQFRMGQVVDILKQDFQTKDFFSGALVLRFFKDENHQIRGIVCDPTHMGFEDLFNNRLRFIGIPQRENPNEEEFSRFATRILNDPILILRLVYLCVKERAFNEYEYYLSLLDRDTLFNNVPVGRLKMWINKMSMITVERNGVIHQPCFEELARLGFLDPLLRKANSQNSIAMIASAMSIPPTAIAPTAIAPPAKKATETAEKEKKHEVSLALPATPAAQPAARKP